MTYPCIVLFALLTAMPLAAQPVTPATTAPDLASIPPNAWTPPAALSGQNVGNASYGGPAIGLVAVPEMGLVAVGGAPGTPATAWVLDWPSRKWRPLLPSTPEKLKPKGEPYTTYVWDAPTYHLAADGRAVPNNACFSVTQVCHDSDRNVIVGFSRGDTVEFDLASRTWSKVTTQPSPPDVTVGSLCYDPVNKEVLLATGGFSPMGGTDGTWLYDGSKKAWRRLAGPPAVDAVRLPLEQAKDRLVTLRWLVWKNLEFRATGREKLLDERSRGETLAKECAALSAELKRLAGLAARGDCAKLDRDRMAAAGKAIDESAGKLDGLDVKLAAASPEALEPLYRDNFVPAQDAAERAVAELAITPEPRMSARLVYDSKNKAIVCFGGDGQSRSWGDTWVYHCDGRRWERRHPKLHPGPQSARCVVFDERNGVVVVNNAWAYNAAKDEWSRLEIPGPKEMMFAEYDPVSGAIVAFNANLTAGSGLRLDLASAKTSPAKETSEVALMGISGEYVLRDATTLADLKTWKAQQDAWATSMPDNTWRAVPIRGTGRPNWGRSWSTILYDPDRLQIYYRDGGHGSYHGAVTDHYDLPTGRWFRSARRDEPPWPMGSYFAWGRSFSYAPFCIHNYKYHLWYNPLTHRLNRGVLHTPQRYPGLKGGTHEYDPDTGLWSRDMCAASNNVSGIPNGLMVVDPWDRYNPKATTPVTYVTADGVKKWPATGAVPYQHSWDGGRCFFFDPKRNLAMYYGGPRGKYSLMSLDVSQADPKWQTLQYTVDGGGPVEPGREIVYVPRHDAFVMTSPQGKLLGNGFADLQIWALDVATRTFHHVKLAVGPGVSLYNDPVSHGLQYDPVSDLCYFCGMAQGYRIMWYAFRYKPEAPAK